VFHVETIWFTKRNMETVPAQDFIAPKPEDIEVLGLNLVYGRGKIHASERLRTERFRGHYGISPSAYAALYADLQKSIDGFVPNLEKLLLMGRFLFLYESRVVLAGATGLDEGTIAKWTWQYLRMLQGLKEQKVSRFRLKSRKIIARLSDIHFGCCF
jgi:hypothetical protein